MNSKISFYSFKDSDITKPPQRLRVNKQSDFELFQIVRQKQTERRMPPQTHRKAASLSVLVRSQQEKQLLNFLKVPNLPDIKLSNSHNLRNKKRGKSTVKNPEIAEISPLDKILSNQKKFMKTYFRKLHDFEERKGIEPITHVFEEVESFGWKVKGYLKGKHLMLRGIHFCGHESFLKYPYSKYVQEVQTNYEEFVDYKVETQLRVEHQCPYC